MPREYNDRERVNHYRNPNHLQNSIVSIVLVHLGKYQGRQE